MLYVQNLKAGMDAMIACIRQAAGAGSNSQVEEIYRQHTSVDEQLQQKQRLMLLEARAVHMGEPIPAEVVQARRRTVAAAAAAAQQGVQGLF
jgi:hypothetical protein